MKDYYRAILFFLVVTMLAAGCDVFNSDGDDASNREPFFNFEVQDESGELLTAASSEQLDGTEIETGVGLFGEEFVSPDLIERLRENTGLDLSREAFKQKRIFLHAEEGEGIGDSVRFASVNFSFVRMNEWQEGKFEIRGFSKEERLARLRRAFERFRSHRQDTMEMDGPTPNDTTFVDTTDSFFPDFDPNETVFMNYFESDGDGFPPEYSFMPVEGFIELQKVTEDRITGSFEVELSGLRSEMFPSVEDDEFPENLEFQTFTIRGDFAARYGNYEDLAQLRAQRVKELMRSGSGGPVFLF